MRIVQAATQPPLATALAEAWMRDESFVLLPARTSLDPATVTSWLAGAPASWAEGHYVLLTSGSTGLPKLVVGARARTQALARALHVAQDLDEVAEAVVLLPLSYSYAFVNQFVWATIHGRRLVVTEGLGAPAEVLAALDGARDAMLCLVGSQVPLLRQHAGSRRFPGVTRLHFAGGRFPQEQLPYLRGLFPAARIYNNYGCAEALPRLTVRRADASDEGANVGAPLPGIELAAAPDGRLLFRSPFRAVGLVEDGVVRVLDDAEWLASGDLAEPVGDGSWRLLGRSGDVFKRFGEKVSLASLLAAVHAVWPGAAAFHLESAQGEPAHVLTLAPAPDPAALRDVLAALRRGFSRAQWPVRIEARATLPTLPNGKPDGRALADSPGAETLWRQRL